MANTRVISKFAGVETASLVISDIASKDYYIFASKHMPFSGNDSITSSLTESYQSFVYDAYDQMLFGKRIQSTDVSLMIDRNTWTSNTVYTMYDDAQVDLFSKAFYVSVLDGSTYYVYKCLDNAGGSPSLYAPSGTSNATFTTADDYIWKYMYSISSVGHTKFATTNYIPVVANTSVTNSAIDGSIEAIKIEVAGAGYDNYIATGTFTAADIAVGGNPLIHKLVATASTLDSFYENCIIKVTAGAAVGQYRKIIGYTGATRAATIDNIFSPEIATGDTYEVYPFIDVFNNGYQDSTNCIARAIINANTGNSIGSVEILNVGAGYKAATTTIRPGNTVSIDTEAQLRAIISPPGGHGSNAALELGASKVCFRTTFSNTEGSYIPATNDFRAVGILKTPLLDNVTLISNSSIGSFLVGESVYQYKRKLLTSNATVSSNTTIAGSGTSYDVQLAANDKIIVTDGSSSFYTSVVTVTNSTSFSVSTNATFTGSNCLLYYVDPIRFGTVSGLAANAVTLTDVSLTNRTTSPLYFGSTSSATLVANAIYHNEKTNPNNFFTFVQLQRFIGDLTSGSFAQDDTVTQTSALPQVVPSGQVHSLVVGGGANDDVLYVSNVHNIFDTNSSISSSSGGTFSLSYKYTGDLVKDTGQILYLENFQPLTRNTSTTETIKLILEY